jgi:hypothetical protein
MKLSTGDIVEIEVCQFPNKKSYLLNGLRYDTLDDLIKEFLMTKNLFTPDFDYLTGLLSVVEIYEIGILNRLFHKFKFRMPLYRVDLGEPLWRILCDQRAIEDYDVQLRIICVYLEELLHPTGSKKQICTIYS